MRRDTGAPRPGTRHGAQDGHTDRIGRAQYTTGRAPVDTLLGRLDAVRQTAPDRWMARCPAHDDRTPSLSLYECGDGTILLRCWAGCAAAEVVAAVGLELRDLFPAPVGHHRPPGHTRRVPAADRLAVIDHEVMVVALLADEIARAGTASDDQRHRLATAASRIGRARDG